jgi:putative ABC transport system permease protein
MPTLAHRNLFHDKIRLAVTLTGVAFAVVLIVIEMGLYVGFTRTTSSLIDHSGADLWVATKDIPYLELGAPFRERKLYRVKTAPGVSEAARFVMEGVRWTRPDGAQQLIQVVGFDPDSGMGGPWNMVEGDAHDLKIPDGVIIDEFYKRKLGVTRIGEVFEINGHRAQVVGFTRGIRSFTTEPYVFTSVKHAQDFLGLQEDQTMFALVKTEPGANVDEVRRNILARVDGLDVLTTHEFSRRTQRYWTFATGAGIAILLGAILGLVVGFVVVTQTIYATTMDHLKEFGTLKAMGAPNMYIYKIILTQAGIAAVVGYGLGIVVSSIVVGYSQPAGAPVLMNGWMITLTFFLTLFMCVGAALVSINKATRLDPASVFKG